MKLLVERRSLNLLHQFLIFTSGIYIIMCFFTGPTDTMNKDTGLNSGSGVSDGLTVERSHQTGGKSFTILKVL